MNATLKSLFMTVHKEVEASGRCRHRKHVREVTMVLIAAGQIGCNLQLFPGKARISGKVIVRERKRVLKWANEHRPELEAAYQSSLTASSEPSESTPPPPTTPSTESPTPESAQ